MGIIIKFLLKNIGEKKFRTALILISVMMSATLYMGTVGMSTTVSKMYKERIKQWVGSAELRLHGKRNSSSAFFLPEIINPYRDNFEYAVGFIQTNATVKHENETINFSLYGFEYDEVRQINPFPLVDEFRPLPFTGRKAIIGKSTADRYNLTPGRSLKLDINGTEHRFVIVGIAAPTGFFTDDGRSNAIIIPLKTMAAFADSRGRVSGMFLKTKPEVDKLEMLALLKRELPRNDVYETISDRELSVWMDNVTMPFKITLAIVLTISVFIIYSSFHVITTERLPVIGTFRSVGATKLTTDTVLFAESFLYGVLGGAVGTGLGIAAIYWMTKATMPQWLEKVGMSLEFTPVQMLQSFLLALGLALISSAIPIIRVSKLPVKDIILGNVRHHVKKNNRKRIIGAVFLVIAFGAPFLAPKKAAVVIDTAALLFAVAGMTQFVPDITEGFVLLLQRAYRSVFGNIGSLSAKNLRDNTSILNNIILLSIGISGLFLITTISNSVAVSVVKHYRESNYDLELSTWNMDRGIEMTVRTVPGVADTYGIYDARRVRVANTDKQINIIHGVDEEKYPEYFDFEFAGNREELLARLDTGRFIIITTTLKRQHDWKIGDSINLELGKRPKEYEIIGFLNSLMWNGSYALIGERFLKMDTGRRTYADLYIKSSVPPEQLQQRLTGKFRRRWVWTMTLDQMESRELESNRQLFSVLRGFSYMATIIGIIGIINNFIIGFIERKRSLALFRSTGMSRGQTVSMVFIEALSGGIIGAISGLITGLLMLAIIPRLLTDMALPVVVVVSKITFVQFLAGGIIVTLFASVSPALKSSKLNIIEAIKYE